MLKSLLFKQHFSHLFNLTSLFFLLLGVAFTLVFAPFNLYILTSILMMPVFYTCLNSTPKQAAIYSFFFGFGHFLSGVYWVYISIHTYGNAPSWIALLLMLGLVILMSFYFYLAGYLISWLVAGRSFWLVLIGPSVWVLFEWIKGWAFSGFPWLSIGYSQIDTFLSGWGPVLGIYGISWFLLLSTAAFLHFYLRQRYLKALSLMALPYLFGALLLSYSWTEDFGQPITTSIIQGGVSQDLKWKDEQLPKTMDLYLQATLNTENDSFVIWPEVAIPASLDQLESYVDFLQKNLKRTNKKLAIGVLEKNEGSTHSYNSMMFLDGTNRQFYRKRHLVPFGEYFPVPNFVRQWMRMYSLPSSDLLEGEDNQALIEFGERIFLATAICYEIAFGSEQLYAFPQASILLNISNDAWFGDSIAPHQHLQITRMRALETGRYLIRSTNNGISAFIDPQGKLRKKSGQFEFEVLSSFVQPRVGLTPYVLFGNWPIIVIIFCVISFAGYKRIRVF
ncbi:MAG TPA: apolipoprotein N-acyltransferase [Woeseiaceae bacterium]|nr:apolipoprotein N-acyltransferase [Woeseiaceae bacterium]|tara:strand:+ start:6929 stop:8443 length:1515 start_codon:yes stop_codon:yes gene_type:complete